MDKILSKLAKKGKNMSLPHNHNKQSINLKLVESIINSQQFESVTIIFKLLSNLTRLKIF